MKIKEGPRTPSLPPLIDNSFVRNPYHSVVAPGLLILPSPVLVAANLFEDPEFPSGREDGGKSLNTHRFLATTP